MSIYSEPITILEKSINSILNQTYQNIEFVIIVDNPQNKMAIEYLKKIRDERIKLFINSENKGLVYSLNKGIAECSGIYIARMDADDIAESNRFEKELGYLKSQNLDLVSSNYLIIDQNDKLIGRTNFPQGQRKIKRLLAKKNCLGHPTWLGKKSVFESLNGYRNIDSCEDYDFLIRLSISGFAFDNCKKPLLKYRFNVKGISRKKESKQKIISKILASNYKLNKVTNLTSLETYLKSTDFKYALKQQEKLKQLKKNFPNCNVVSKIKCLYQIMLLKFRIYQKFNKTFRGRLC